jgi:hypothetical protein
MPAQGGLLSQRSFPQYSRQLDELLDISNFRVPLLFAGIESKSPDPLVSRKEVHNDLKRAAKQGDFL